ncbi:MAG: STAS domain-containing protein [Spirochaetales bacterium]|nr:STAS domain-containing protein [Spirochaetales bacterium]
MELSVRSKDKHKIIAIKGEVDLYSVGQLKKDIMSHIDDTVTSLVIDMTELSHMDSSGIALMAQLQKKMKSVNGSFCFLNINQDVMNVLKLAALDKFFKIYNSEAEIA